MFLPIDPVILVIPLTGIVAAGGFVLYDSWLTARCRLLGGVEGKHHHCRYCHWGQAYLTEETIRRDGDEVVEVHCFVCARCGLPQWTVERTPLVVGS